ncbi:hypothetical protein GCM10022226_66340 [Sphaerisporangium flaviroseum]|uniref:Uncharacterized protein n=1 Tax=Sphaerisporangium flaviroseum TaxID=509199 RepID=A0ABP7J5K0_9ACTN
MWTWLLTPTSPARGARCGISGVDLVAGSNLPGTRSAVWSRWCGLGCRLQRPRHAERGVELAVWTWLPLQLARCAERGVWFQVNPSIGGPGARTAPTIGL